MVLKTWPVMWAQSIRLFIPSWLFSCWLLVSSSPLGSLCKTIFFLLLCFCCLISYFFIIFISFSQIWSDIEQKDTRFEERARHLSNRLGLYGNWRFLLGLVSRNLCLIEHNKSHIISSLIIQIRQKATTKLIPIRFFFIYLFI